MKKILSALLVFTMVIATFAFTTSAAYSGTPAEKFWTGKQMTIEVDTAEKLVAVFAAMSNKAEFAKKTIKLTADIVLNDAALDDMKANKAGLFNWADVVDFNFEFGGIFDGNGHTISGLYYENRGKGPHGNIEFGDNGNEHTNTALFPKTSANAVIKNLRLTNSYVAGAYNTAFLVGTAGGNNKYENIQIDNSYLLGTYKQTADPAKDVLETAGLYEKHSNTGAIQGNCANASYFINNVVVQGTVAGGGRFVGGFFGNMQQAHIETTNSGFIGVYESFYETFYPNGVNLHKENSGGLLGRCTDKINAEKGCIFTNTFFIGDFKANKKSTTSGLVAGRADLMTIDNFWANDDAYTYFGGTDKTKDTNEYNKCNTEKKSKLTGKDAADIIGLDSSVWYSMDGIGPMLVLFKQAAAEEVTTAVKTEIQIKPEPEKPADTSKKDEKPADTSKNDDNKPADTSAKPSTKKPTPSKKPSTNTGDITVYMIAAVVISAAAAVVISKSRA